MGAPNNVVVIIDQSGGVNDTDVPLALKATECLQAVNVEWVYTRFGRRRKGSRVMISSFVVSPTTGLAAAWTTPIGSMVRHVSGTDEGWAEIWAVDDTPLFGRKVLSNQFAEVAQRDVMTGRACDVTWATVDGCLFVAYQSAVNRLHVWDGASFRRTGLSIDTTILGVVTDTGVGTYAAIPRHYRGRWNNGNAHLFSAAMPWSPSPFTPSG
ncbi:MAG TPA: hypothetical protein VE200_08685, partial [Xanthobacteraceae bacterium]|nr:hypothetical protein [Xanthobacteraceae bacterium]